LYFGVAEKSSCATIPGKPRACNRSLTPSITFDQASFSSWTWCASSLMIIKVVAPSDGVDQLFGRAGFEVATYRRRQQRLNRVWRRSRFLLIEAVNVREVEHAASSRRRRLVLENNLQIEVRRPLRRHERILEKDAAGAEVFTQPFKHDQVRRDHDEVAR